jgi:hypothetical protein
MEHIKIFHQDQQPTAAKIEEERQGDPHPQFSRILLQL